MRVLLDMDGVLADFVGAMCTSHERENPFDNGYCDYSLEDGWGISSKEFWEPSNSIEWWANIPKTEEADQIVDLVDGFAYDVCILSSPSVSPYSLAGKVMWLQKHYPQFSRKFLIGPAKEFCAHPGNVLIDDSDANIDKFSYCGGRAILVPRPWNTNRNLRSIVVDYLRQELNTYAQNWKSFPTLV